MMRAQDWIGNTVVVGALVLRPTVILAALISTMLVAGCGQTDPAPPAAAAPASSAPAANEPAPAKPRTVADANTPSTNGVVVLGDSLAFVQGMESEQSWVGMLAAQSDVSVTNLSNIGDSSSRAGAMLGGVLTRLKPQVLVVAMGGDDGINGLRLTEIEENLTRIIIQAQSADVKVVLVASALPMNYGADYRKGFDEMFVNLSERHKVVLVKNVLPTDQAGLVQKDTNAPTLAAQPLIFKQVAPAVQAALK